MTNDYFVEKQEIRGINYSKFNAELERAEKNSLDARDVCLSEWNVRNGTHELLEKLCFTIKEIIRGKIVDSDYKESEGQTSKVLLEEADLHFKLARTKNEEIVENKRRISQILDITLLQLEDTPTRFRELTTSGNCTEVVKQVLCDRVDALVQFYLSLGTHSTSLFYEKNQIYQKLKSKPYRICCVCGIKSPTADESTELKDALAFKELLFVEDRDLAEWMALKDDDEDELGAIAQMCFHIAHVEHEGRYYHILNLDDPDPVNPLEQSCCLIHDGKLLRLPACDECFERLKKADKFLKEEAEAEDSAASSNETHLKSDDGGLST